MVYQKIVECLVTILATAGNDIELTTILLKNFESLRKRKVLAHIFFNNELLSSYLAKQADCRNCNE